MFESGGQATAEPLTEPLTCDCRDTHTKGGETKGELTFTRDWNHLLGEHTTVSGM